jgi:hypothetical protein
MRRFLKICEGANRMCSELVNQGETEMNFVSIFINCEQRNLSEKSGFVYVVHGCGWFSRWV